MTTLVSALVAHPLLPGLALASGPDTVEVASVEGARLDDILDASLTPTGLVVLLDRFDRTGWRFDRALALLSGAGVRALVIDQRTLLTPASTLLSERLGMTLLTTPNPGGALFGLRDLVTGGTVAIASIVTRTVSVIDRADSGLDELFTQVGRVLGRPVVLCDRTGRVLAPAGAELAPAAVQALASTDAARLVSVSGRVLDGLVIAPVPTGSAPPPLVAVLADDASAVEIDQIRAALPVVALAAGHRLAVARLQDERLARGRTTLFADLVAAGENVPSTILRRAIHQGWSTDGWHLGIRVIPRVDVDSVAHRDDVLQALEAQGIAAAVVEQEHGWVAWITFAEEPGVGDVDHHVKALRRAQAQWELTAPMSLGVGRVHRGPAGIVVSLEEASDAARLAASRPNSGYFLHVDRLGLAQLLLAWTQTDTFLPAAKELLAPLREPGGSRLLETLVAYLDAQSSATETAMVLGIHRNTVTERISRIEALLGVDLRDGESRLALHLACRSLDLT